jgi:phosphohistidine phosphatase SixA
MTVPPPTRRTLLATLGVAPLASGFAAATQAQPDPLVELRRGRGILYLRHAETETTPEPAEREHRDCAWQRNLSAAGRAQAADFGQALKRMKIDAGVVLSSPFCRCRDTAQLAFGAFKVEPALGWHVSRTLNQQTAMYEALRQLIVAGPPRGRTLILVGHAPPLKALAGVELAECEAAVVQPRNDGSIAVTARVTAAGVRAA